jgi:hypothetical protein
VTVTVTGTVINYGTSSGIKLRLRFLRFRKNCLLHLEDLDVAGEHSEAWAHHNHNSNRDRDRDRDCDCDRNRNSN